MHPAAMDESLLAIGRGVKFGEGSLPIACFSRNIFKYLADRRDLFSTFQCTCHSGLHKERCPSAHTYLVTVGDLAARKKEQQLQAELSRMSGAKEQQISSLKEELQGMQEKLTALREDSEQKEQKMKGEEVRLELNREHAITGNVLPLTDM